MLHGTQRSKVLLQTITGHTPEESSLSYEAIQYDKVKNLLVINILEGEVQCWNWEWCGELCTFCISFFINISFMFNYELLHSLLPKFQTSWVQWTPCTPNMFMEKENREQTFTENVNNEWGIKSSSVGLYHNKKSLNRSI